MTVTLYEVYVCYKEMKSNIQVALEAEKEVAECLSAWYILNDQTYNACHPIPTPAPLVFVMNR